MQPLPFCVCLLCQQYCSAQNVGLTLHRRKIYLHFTQLSFQRNNMGCQYAYFSETLLSVVPPINVALIIPQQAVIFVAQILEHLQRIV